MFPAIFLAALSSVTQRPLLATGSLTVPLTVKERAGVTRVNAVVQSGIPLPRGAQITSTDGLAIIDGSTGQVVDADFVVTARWGGSATQSSKPIKWLLATFKASVSANGSAGYVLTDYRPGNASQQISLDKSDAVFWVVDTGAARFEITKSGFDLLRRVTIGGKDLVTPSSSNGPYYTLAGATYTAATAGGGGSELSVHREGSRGQTLTLKVKGSHRTYSNRDDDDIDFNTYLTFYAGSSAVRVQHAVQNNRDWVALQNNADFRNIGSPNSVYADEIGLRFGLSAGSNPQWSVGTSAGATPLSGGLTDTVSVYQDNSGDSNWDMWISRRPTGNDGTGTVDAPIYGPQAYVRSDLRGYEVKNGSSQIKTGSKMTGFLDVTGADGGVTVAVRDFWQNFPKALRVTATGRIEVGLFPAEFRARHNLRVGEQKTHDILFYFHGPGVDDADEYGAGFAKPLMAVAPPSWYAEICRVIPAVSVDASNAYRFSTVAANPDAPCAQPDATPAEWDRFMVRHLEGPGADDNSCSSSQTDYAFNGLDEAIPASQMYSWMDYGDIPIDFEDQAYCGGQPMRMLTGQYGWKYDGDYGIMMNFLRSGNYRFLDYGLAAAEHVGDVDIMHHGRQSGRGINWFLDGGMFGHEQHDENGDINPHRNGYPAACSGDGWNGTPSADMIYGTGALCLAYYLTGEPQLAESVLDIADWTIHVAENWDVTDSRKGGNALRTLAWGFSLAHDSAYSDSADQLIRTSDYFKNPMQPGRMQDMAADALGFYVSFLREADDTHQDSMLEYIASNDVAVDDYISDVLKADVHSWASMLLASGKAANLAKADEYFANGVRNPAWTNASFGIGRVFQIKEWVYDLQGSQVYQLATYQARGGPPFSPQAPAVTPSGGAANQNRPPVAVVSAPSNGSTGDAITFDASGSSDPDGTALSYLWDFGDGTTATGRTTSHTYEESGSWTARLYVSDSEGVGMAQQTETIAFTNHAPVANAGADRSAPVGVTITFDASASTDIDSQPLTYSWDFGDNQTGTGVAASHSYSTAGTYTVTLTTSDGSLTGTDTAIVTINAVSDVSYTVSFRDGENGYSGTLDTRLWSKSAATNYGAEPDLYIGRQDYPELNALVRFDLSAIPAGSKIDSATLELSVSEESTTTPVRVHRVSALPQDWVEGTGCCSNDGATWKTYDGTHAWTSAGGDFEPHTTTFVAPAANQPLLVDVTSIVQPWTLGTSNQGFGFTLDPSGNYRYVYLHTSEATTVGYRPKLTVTYRPLATGGGGGVRGDANNDGSVTASDVFFLINYLFAGGSAPATTCGGDANIDSAVTASDVFFLINYLFAGGTAPSGC